MGLRRQFEQRWNAPAKPNPVPVASDEMVLTACPACSVEIRPGAVLCVSCGARLGKIETVISVVQATRAPCPACGYDMSGLTRTTCPECGAEAPNVPPRLEVLTEKEELFQRQAVREAYRRPLLAVFWGFALLMALVSWWYGLNGVKFWCAAIVPTWIAACIGYFVLGTIVRFLDSTITITAAQVLGVVMFGLLATALVFPYVNGVVYWGALQSILPFALVAAMTRLVMEDDDWIDSAVASLPIALSCIIVPAILLAILS